MTRHAWRRLVPLLSFFLAGAAFPLAPAGAQGLSLRQRKEFQALSRELEEEKREIAGYKKREEALAGELRGLRSRLAASRELRAKIRAQLREAESRRRDLERQARGTRRAEKQWRSGLSASLLEYRAADILSSPYYGLEDLWERALIGAGVLQDAVFLARMRDFESAAARQARDMRGRSKALRRESRATERDQSARSAALKEKARALAEARASGDRARSRLRELEESARAMNRLIAALGKKASSAPRRTAGALSRHSLPWPVQGSVLSGFGRRQVPGLRTWMIQHGIELSAAPGSPVCSVRSGQVIFAGPFRSYGQVVIVDHGRRLFSLYGGLGSIARPNGSTVAAGEVLGTAGGLEGGKGLYFELRRDGAPLDPLVWLRPRQ